MQSNHHQDDPIDVTLFFSQAFDFLAIQNLASLGILNLRTCTSWPLGCLASTYHSSPTLTGSAIIDHGWGTGLSPLLPSLFRRRIQVAGALGCALSPRAVLYPSTN